MNETPETPGAAHHNRRSGPVRRRRAGRLTAVMMTALALLTACSGGSSPSSPTAPSPPGSSAVFYVAIGASDAAGVGSSVPCLPLTACSDGTGYVPVIARRLRASREVTLTNLSLPGGVLSSDLETLGNSLGRQIPGNFIDRLAPFVPPQATLVTIFAGGNDTNTIASAIGAGRGGGDPAGYLTQQVQAYARDYGRLIDAVRARAPGAVIVVLNLPNMGALPYVAGRPLPERRIVQDVAVRLTTEAINPLASRVPVVDSMCDGRSYDPRIYSADGFHPNDIGYTYLADLLLPAITAGSAPAPAARCGFMTLVG